MDQIDLSKSFLRARMACKEVSGSVQTSGVDNGVPPGKNRLRLKRTLSKGHDKMSLHFGFLLGIFMLIAACGTLEVGVETTPISPIQASGTQVMPPDTQEPAPPVQASPTQPGNGLVTGRVCFPSEKVPAMTAYFEEVGTREAHELPIAEDQTQYQVELPEGTYQAYAWLPGFEYGGLYSQAVPCGLLAECGDHSPIIFDVSGGETVSGVDLCDWYGGPGSVPLPPGVTAPTGSPLAGLVVSMGGSVFQLDQGGVPVQVSGERLRVLSPDGRQAILEMDDDLWIIDLPGGTARNVTNSPDRAERCARWWPARPELIVFTYQPLDDLGPSCGFLSVAGIDGSDYRVLDTTMQSATDPAPSPDGEVIAYDSGLTARFYNWSGDSVDLDPNAFGLAGLPVSKIGSPAWSPDGKKLAWVIAQGSELSVAVFDLEQGTAVKLHPYTPLGGRGGWPEPPTWSPDGEWLAFVTWGESQELLKVGLWVSRPDGTEEHLLGPSNAPFWSPDGTRLAFQRVDESNMTGIWLVQAGIWEPEQVLSLPSSGDTLIGWTPLN